MAMSSWATVAKVVFATLAVGCFFTAQTAQASDLCNAESSVAMTIAKARDRGVKEAQVDEQLRQTFPDPAQQQGVIALANVVYTSPDMSKMSPEDIGSAVGGNCETHNPQAK
jgi:outer membrane lipoprotein-sorting protein